MSDAPESRADAWVAEAPEGSRERELRARAREWADRVSAATGMSGGWRMQVLSLRTRRDFRPASGDPASDLATSFGTDAYAPPSDASGAACPDRPMRLRRFVSGCPWPLVERVVRYLHVVAPYAGVVVDGSPTGASWRPTLTTWTRDAQTQTGPDATCTLVQDLVELTACGDSEVLATGASCLSAEETRYEWDAASVEAVSAECPGQGVSVSVQAVRRNEDGTFDYQVVTSRARSRHVAAHAVQCDAAHSATEERWENLYGEPGSLRASGLGGEPAPCDGFGALPDLPAGSCSSSEAGVSTRWEVQLNRDCTYSVSKTVVTALRQAGSWADGTSCRPQSHETVRGSREAPPQSGPRSPGVRVDVRASLGDDGTWSWERTETRSPDETYVRWLDGTVRRPRTVEHSQFLRARADALARVPARAVGLSVDAQVSMNDDCTWDARVARTDAPDADFVDWSDGSDCRPRERRAGWNYRAARSSDPRDPGAKDMMFARKAGYRVESRLSRNEDGTWDFESSREKTSPAWGAEWDDGSDCRPRENARYAGLGTRDEALRKVKAYAMSGWTLQADVRMSDDCTWDVSMSRTKLSTAWDDTWKSGTGCSPTDHHAWRGQASVPAVLKDDPLAGETVRASLSRNDDCTYDAERSVTTRAASGAKTWYEGSSCRPVEVTGEWGVVAPPSGRPAQGQSVSVSVRRNEDCTFDVERRVRTRASGSGPVKWSDGAASASYTDHEADDGLASAPSIRPGSSPGVSVRARVSKSEDCTYEYEKSVTRSVPDEHTWTEGTPCRPVDVTARWAQPAKPSVSTGGAGTDTSASVQRNADGTYDSVVRVRQPAQPDASGNWTDGSATQQTVHNIHSHVASVPSVQPGSSPGVSVRASFSRGEDCTYSGEVATTTAKGDSKSWDEGSRCAPVTATIYDHVASIPSVGNSSGHTSASFHREADGTYSGTVRRQTSTPDPGSDLSWDTVERTPTSELRYKCTLRVFSHVAKVPVPKSGSSVSVSVRLEDDCTYSGQITTRKLTSWVVRSGGGGGGEGSEEYTKKEYFVYDGYLYVNDVKYRVYKPSGVTVVVNESGPKRGALL